MHFVGTCSLARLLGNLGTVTIPQDRFVKQGETHSGLNSILMAQGPSQEMCIAHHSCQFSSCSALRTAVVKVNKQTNGAWAKHSLFCIHCFYRDSSPMNMDVRHWHTQSAFQSFCLGFAYGFESIFKKAGTGARCFFGWLVINWILKTQERRDTGSFKVCAH